MQATGSNDTHAWGAAFAALDTKRSPSEAWQIANMALDCPVSAVREDELARLCQQDSDLAVHAGTATANKHSMSPASFENLLLACMHSVDPG